MNGEFRCDISRNTFDKKKHFSRVLMQQGRVQLDADWNEQSDILLHYMQTLAKDLMGHFAVIEKGFAITIPSVDVEYGTFDIGRGRCYVEGILCENESEDELCGTSKSKSSKPVGEPEGLDYLHQPDYPINKVEIPPSDLPLMVYLDVWERHISCIEDDDIREKALEGPDTATRSKTVWQVKVLSGNSSNIWKEKNWGSDPMQKCGKIFVYWPDIVRSDLQNPYRGCLSAQAKKPSGNDTDPCIISPDSRYRRAENQLYRVEIHRGGVVGEGDRNATFKWSRDNGTNVFPISFISDKEFTLEHLGRDDRSSLNVGDWVEVIDDDYTLLIGSRPSPLHEPTPLAQVMSVSLTEMKVTLDSLPNYNVNMDKHPLLRRWDFKEGDPKQPDQAKLAKEGNVVFGLYVKEGKCDSPNALGWLTLEDGVQICFRKPDADKKNEYQAGDYWLIPARTATGDVEWPFKDQTKSQRVACPPHGIEHHYAPLAVIYQDQNNWVATECRCTIQPLSKCPDETKPN